MENEFVKYEQALILKELGFDEQCLALYDLDGKITIEFVNWKNAINRKNNYLIAAPLYQQIFRWFREKYKLFITVCHDHRDKNDITPYFYMIDDCPFLNYKVYKTQKDIDIQKTLVYKTYKEAEIECLKKLIEIVKNK